MSGMAGAMTEDVNGLQIQHLVPRHKKGLDKYYARYDAHEEYAADVEGLLPTWPVDRILGIIFAVPVNEMRIYCGTTLGR
jgi:hypothetical protein